MYKQSFLSLVVFWNVGSTIVSCVRGILWRNSWTLEQTESWGVLELAAQTAKPLGTEAYSMAPVRQKQTNLNGFELFFSEDTKPYSIDQMTRPETNFTCCALLRFDYAFHNTQLLERDQHDKRTTNEQPLLADPLTAAARSMTEQILALVPDLFLACLEVKQRRDRWFNDGVS